MPHLAGWESLRHYALCGAATDLSAQIDRTRINAAHSRCVARFSGFFAA